MPRIAVECTHCGAKLNLADESKLGKKIKCPKCSETFVASSEDDEDLDDIEDDDDEDEDERPRGKKGAAASAGAKKGAPAKGGGGKKGKGKSGSNVGLIIGGAVGAVVLLIGLVGGLIAAGVFSGPKLDPNQITVGPGGNGVFGALLKEQGPTPVPPRGPVPEEAKWLPADAEFVIHVRVAEILAAPVVSEILKTTQTDALINQPIPGFDLKPTDIESVSYGVAGLDQFEKQVQQAQMSVMMGRPPASQSMPGIGVVKLKQPITYDAIQKAAQGLQVQKAQHAGKDYLVASPPNSSTKSGTYLASDRLIIFAEEPALKAAIEKGPASNPVPSFGFVDWTDHLLLAVAPKDLKKLQKSAGGTGNPMFDQMADTFANGATGYALGLTVKGGLEAEFATGCLDQSKMDAIVKTLNDLIGLGKLQYEQSKKELPPFATELTDQLVANAKTSGSNRVALLSTNLPDSEQTKIAQVPAMIMTQFMMNAMLGGPGSGMPRPPGANDFGSDSPGFNPASPPIDSEPTTVKAKSAKRLPKGIELNGLLADGYHQGGESERALDFTLELAFEGEGDDFKIAAVGNPQQGEAKTASGETIPLLAPIPPVGGDPYELCVNFPSFCRITSNPAIYGLTIPADQTEPLESISGTFTFITGKRSKRVQIKNAKEQAGKEPTDPALKAAGFELKLSKEQDSFGETETLTMSVKPGFLLTRVEAIDEEGKTSYEAFPGVSFDKQIQTLKPGVGSLELKDGIGVQFHVYSDLKEVEVPFTFENVELPKKKEEEKSE